MRPKQIQHSTTIFINFEIYIISLPYYNSPYLEHNERDQKNNKKRKTKKYVMHVKKKIDITSSPCEIGDIPTVAVNTTRKSNSTDCLAH